MLGWYLNAMIVEADTTLSLEIYIVAMMIKFKLQVTNKYLSYT